MALVTVTLYPQKPPANNGFQQVPVADTGGAPFVVIPGTANMIIKVWRYIINVSNGSNLGFSSSGGQVLLPKGGGVAGATQYAFQDFPPPACFAPWFQTLAGDGLTLVYDAGTANGIILYSVENPKTNP